MGRRCLVVDLCRKYLVDNWQVKLKDHQLPLELEECKPNEAVERIEKGGIVALVVFVKETSRLLNDIFSTYQKRIGPLNEFQMIVTEDSTPELMVEVFEFGIEKICVANNWPAELAAFCRHVSEILEEPDCPEAKVIEAYSAIYSDDADAIAKVKNDLDKCSTYSFAAAYAKGKVLETEGNTEEAANSFKKSKSLNDFYRPSVESLGKTFVKMGKVDEAIKIFSELEITNPNNANKKLNLANAYIEKGDHEKAKQYLQMVSKIEPDNPKINETRTSLSIKEGNIEAALELMSGMSNVGAEFASELNIRAIELAKVGRGKDALALYAKAHDIVKPELKYKISLNAALACHRMGNFHKALQYADKVEQEYGASYPKLEKIKSAIKAAILKKQSEK